MIGRTNSGTGGGGISSNSALLVVYAPLGSIVTATKDGVTKTSRTDIALSDEPTIGMHLISISSSQLGTWTVTATRGSDSVSSTIAIENTQQYDLSLSYKFYYVENGVTPTGVTFTKLTTHGQESGLTSDARLTQNSGYLTAWIKYGWGYYVAPVDITPYSTLCIDMSLTGANTWYVIGLSTDTQYRDYSKSSTVGAYVAYKKYTAVFNRQTIRIDVSNISGSYYFKIDAWGSTGQNTNMYNVWLE